MQWLRRLLARAPEPEPQPEAPPEPQPEADSMIRRGREAHERVRRTLCDLDAAQVAAHREASGDA